MRIIRAADYGEMSRRLAAVLAAQITLKPESVLGLATGSTPIGCYQQLVKWHQQGDLDFSGLTSVNLDEYKGLSPENDQSYHYFMHENLFDHVNMRPGSVHLPNGLEEDAEKECARYDALICSLGGIDLQLLGIGHNGHIGFNEPADAFAKGTNCVKLTESTLKANSIYFESEAAMPHYAYTMGIQTIMQAKKVVIAASGKGKAPIVRDAFFGPITPQVPASILQLHPDVLLVADEAALSLIP